jgi:hypothetical protein
VFHVVVFSVLTAHVMALVAGLLARVLFWARLT